MIEEETKQSALHLGSELILVSSKFDVDELGTIAKDLLRDKEVKKLLNLSKLKKANGGNLYPYND